MGATLSVNLKVSEQCGVATLKVNKILGLTRRNVVHKEEEIIIPLYKPIVGPHLEYCIQDWRSSCKKALAILAIIQRSKKPYVIVIRHNGQSALYRSFTL